jgi:hypothetical protein
MTMDRVEQQPAARQYECDQRQGKRVPGRVWLHPHPSQLISFGFIRPNQGPGPRVSRSSLGMSASFD